jgi:hypothetical protein
VCADYVSHVHRRTKVAGSSSSSIFFSFPPPTIFEGVGKKTNVEVKNPNEVIRFPLADLFLLVDGIFVPHVDPRYLLITDAVNTPSRSNTRNLSGP